MHISVTRESYPIRGQFRISRGAKTSAEVLICHVRKGSHVGRGECVPYARYGETIGSVEELIHAFAIG
ncbi:MAG: dipeptide epimerase, partial [Pseudomonadota bacterium]